MGNTPAHLPQRLTISFPIWLLYGIEYDSPYYDLDTLMQEHTERGFNCIRFDDGAGLLFDKTGKPLPPFRSRRAFGKADAFVRQMQGSEAMMVDLPQRLVRICEAAKKHGITLILSTWYYLHTFWKVDCQALNDRLFAIPPHNVFGDFAGFLDQILSMLEKEGLDDCIAFAEIMNEADCLDILGGYGEKRLSPEEKASFREDHENAMAMLRQRHPQILFAYDAAGAQTDAELIPRNAQVFNFHNYFLWGIYTTFRQEMGERVLLPSQERMTVEQIRSFRSGQRPAMEDWYQRIAYFSNIAPDRFPVAEKWFHQRLERDYDLFTAQMRSALQQAIQLASRILPGAKWVSAEGVSYPESPLLLWEEHSPLYWQLLEETADCYRKAGLWGMAPRTCSGPEDPCWNLNRSQLQKVNQRFLEG